MTVNPRVVDSLEVVFLHHPQLHPHPQTIHSVSLVIHHLILIVKHTQEQIERSLPYMVTRTVLIITWYSMIVLQVVTQRICLVTTLSLRVVRRSQSVRSWIMTEGFRDSIQ